MDSAADGRSGSTSPVIGGPRQATQHYPPSDVELIEVDSDETADDLTSNSAVPIVSSAQQHQHLDNSGSSGAADFIRPNVDPAFSSAAAAPGVAFGAAIGGQDQRSDLLQIAERCESAVAVPPKTPPKNVAEVVSGSPGSEEGQHCTICFETWSNSGDHRIASLRCGHLFGKSCIERWLKGREQRCPHCNEKASVRDIRAIFARNIRVIDTTDQDRALRELGFERESRRKLELDHSIMKLKCKMQESEIRKLQDELAALRRQVGGGVSGAEGVCPASSMSVQQDPSLSLVCTVDVTRAGGCRVMQFNSWMGLLAVSQPSQNALFPGYGVRKINTLDMRASHFVSLHQKQIRDIGFHPEQRDLLLSVSLDGRAVLTNLCSNARVQSWDCAAPCWSCAWDQRCTSLLYVGLSNGTVLALDSRSPDQTLCRFSPPAGSSGPVVGLSHVPGAPGGGSLVICRLSACSVRSRPSDAAGAETSLPLEGPFTSLSYHADTQHLLVSSRPSARSPHATHAVCHLPAGVGGAPSAASVVRVFQGGTTQRLMARSALLSCPPRPASLLVCAGLESSGVVQMWDMASGQCRHRLGTSEPVLDVCSVHNDRAQSVALLNERQVKIYSWQSAAT